jgi:hypothetical protein
MQLYEVGRTEIRKERSMPEYYLHLRDGDEIIEDLEGMDYPDDVAASREAEASARDTLSELIRQGETVNGQRIEICDEAGKIIDTVRFSEQFKKP